MIIEDNACQLSIKNVFCGYTLESPLRGSSHEYPQNRSLLRISKNCHQRPTLLMPSKSFSAHVIVLSLTLGLSALYKCLRHYINIG